MESGHGEAVVHYLEHCIDELRDMGIDPNLPPDQYKVNDLGRQEALKTLKHMLTPFLEYRSDAVRKVIQKDGLYYSHAPHVPKER